MGLMAPEIPNIIWLSITGLIRELSKSKAMIENPIILVRQLKTMRGFCFAVQNPIKDIITRDKKRLRKKAEP